MALKVGKGGTDQGDNSPLVQLRKRFEINSQKPLPQYDSQPALAYEAEHLRDKGRFLMAYVCDPKVPPRLDMIGALHRMDHRCFMRVVDWDVLYWPPEGRRCPVIICERPVGEKVLKDSKDKILPMKEDEIIASFLTPLVQVLRELHEMGICHGNIRPDNIYLSTFENEDGNQASELMLGECYVAPALSTLPMAYNTFTNGLCDPSGRGRGEASDDMYAVGVCILALAAGEDPTVKYVTAEDIQKTKLTYGSYGALAQRYRIANSLMEPLRGLLNDDPKERWGIEDLFLWVNGRRLSPKQQTMPPKAARPYKFLGKDYGTARELAFGLAENWDEAIPIVQDGSVDNWLRRSLQDDQRVEAVNAAKNMTEPASPAEVDRLVARVLMALSADRPIQLRGFSAKFDGVQQLMGLKHKDVEMRTLFLQLLATGLPAFYLELKVHNSADDLSILSKMDKAKALLTQKGFGGGIERIAYQLNSNLPCMSPMFDRDYVPNIDYLLPAINRYARLKGDDVVTLLDKDIVAYIGVHFKHQITEEIRDLNMSDHDYEKAIAEVKILGKLQEAATTKRGLPDLCAAAVIILKPAMERFHSVSTREKVSLKVMKSVETGRILDVLKAVDDPVDSQQDKHGFDLACAEYADSVHGQMDLHNDIQQRSMLATELAGQISSALSGLFAVFTAFGYAIFSVF